MEHVHSEMSYQKIISYVALVMKMSQQFFRGFRAIFGLSNYVAKYIISIFLFLDHCSFVMTFSSPEYNLAESVSILYIF